MNQLRAIKEALTTVYQHPHSFFITLIVALVIFLFNILVNNYKIIFSQFSVSLLFSLISGTLSFMTKPSIVVLSVISVLSGVVITMILFVVRRQIKTSLGAGSGVVLSFLLPGCSSCGIGILSLLGFSGFFSILPFKGLEFGIFGIIILLLSMVYLANKINAQICLLASGGRGARK